MNIEVKDNAIRHPLIIDKDTRLARLATQQDIHRMEAICSAYSRLVRDMNDILQEANETNESITRIYQK